MSYKIMRGDQGVITFEPYKSILLPHWRFRTVPIARESSSTLWAKFMDYDDQHDFVGMDMARKFIQRGMTRANYHANYKGGRKYVEKLEEGKGYGRQWREILEKSSGHEGRGEKLEASEVFREVWQRYMAHAGHAVLRKEFLEEKRAWQSGGESDGEGVKMDTESEG